MTASINTAPYLCDKSLYVNTEEPQEANFLKCYELDREIGQETSAPVAVTCLDYAILNRMDAVAHFIINGCKSSHPFLLNHSTTRHKLSPLHVAVISNNAQAVQLLLSANVDVNTKDHKGWTPFHHAACWGNLDMLNALRRHGADKKALTSTGGTYEDILCLTNKIVRFSPINLLSAEGTLFTPEQYKAITNSEYVAELYVSRIRMIQDWSQDVPKIGIYPFTETFRRKYHEFLAAPLTHCLARVTHDNDANELSMSPGLGLFATQSIPVAAVIGEFTGRLNPFGASVSKFQCGNDGTNAEKFSNGPTRVNRSFPNVAVIRVYNERGLPFREVMISISLIPEGEEKFAQICWNYGFNETCGGPYIELRPNALRSFLRMHPLSHLFKCVLDDLSDRCNSFEDFILAEKFRYILQTPSNLFILALEGFINLETAQKLLAAAYDFQLINKDAPNLLPTTVKEAGQCLKCASIMRQYNSSVADEYLQYFKTLPERVGIVPSLKIARQSNDFFLKSFVQKKLIWECLPPTDQADVMRKLWDGAKDKNNEALKRNL